MSSFYSRLNILSSALTHTKTGLFLKIFRHFIPKVCLADKKSQGIKKKIKLEMKTWGKKVKKVNIEEMQKAGDILLWE